MPLMIPADLAGDLADTLATEPEHPAVDNFLEQARAEVPWALGWPRRLFALGLRLDVNVTDVDRVAVLLTGFRARKRATRIVKALVAVLRATRIGTSIVTTAMSSFSAVSRRAATARRQAGCGRSRMVRSPGRHPRLKRRRPQLRRFDRHARS
jgi:hypothetical protein